MTDCGSSRESCCSSLEVPGGTFYRSYDPLDPIDGAIQTSPDGGPTGQADPATLSAFRLDKYQVTVGRFRQFVRAWNGGVGFVPKLGSGKHAHLNGGLGLVNVGGGGVAYEPGWAPEDSDNLAPTPTNLACLEPYATWTDAVAARENLPIECANWFEAYAFCIWDGGFLPSEAEFEYAAAGGTEQREFPWGSALVGNDSRYAIYDCDYPPEASGKCSDVSNLAPVGTAALGAGRWGQLDLAGNVWQWTLDRFAPYVSPCIDCANLTATANRVMRGSDFGFASQYIMPPSRNSYTPPLRGYIGFRCARSP